MKEKKTFTEFLDGYCKKDQNVREVFVKKYGHIIYQYIIKTFQRYSYSYNEIDTDNIFTDILLTILNENVKKISDFLNQNERTFLAYIRETSFSKAVEYISKRKKFGEQKPFKENDFSKMIHKEVEGRDLKDIIITLRDGLPPRYTYLFKLIYEEGFNFAEIADIMNIKIHAVHQLKSKMIEKIYAIAKKNNLYHELELLMTRSPCLEY